MARSEAVAGYVMLIGAVQFLLLMQTAEYLFPGYSTSSDVISRLGIGPSAMLFNSSVILLGVMGLYAGYLLTRLDRIFSLLIILSSIGAIGVGIFPMDMGILHTIPAFMAFLFIGLATIYSYRVASTPIRYLWLILGLVSMAALILFASGIYLGLGKGGMERMIVYPALIWLISLSTWLISR